MLLQDKHLTKEEIRIFLDYLEAQELLDLRYGRKCGVRNSMMFSLLLNSGIRGSECCNLKHTDLHFGKESWITILGKGSKLRNVAISTELKKQLKDFIIWKRHCKMSVDDDSYLFNSWGDRRYTQVALNRLYKKLLRKAGIKRKLSLHSTRHSYGSWLFQKTKNLRLVQHQLGHSDLRSTQIYLSVCEDMNAAVSDIYS